MNLGLRLELVRRSRQFRQKDLARKVGITAKHLGQLENGHASLMKVRVEVIRALCLVLDVSQDYLLGETNEGGIVP